MATISIRQHLQDAYREIAEQLRRQQEGRAPEGPFDLRFDASTWTAIGLGIERALQYPAADEVRERLSQYVVRPGYIEHLQPERRTRPDLTYREHATIYGDGSQRFDREPVEVSTCKGCDRPVLVDEGVTYGLFGGVHVCAPRFSHLRGHHHG